MDDRGWMCGPEIDVMMYSCNKFDLMQFYNNNNVYIKRV